MTYTPSVDYKDFEDYLKKNGYLESINKLNEFSRSSLGNTVSDLNEQKKKAASDAGELARQAYIKYANAKAALPEKLSHSGYTGGMADSLRVSLENEYQNAYNKIQSDKSSRMYDIDKQIESAGRSADADAAERLYKLYASAASAYGDSLEESEKRYFNEYLTDLKAKNELEQLNVKNAFTEKQNELSRQKDIASLALKVGDMSKLKELGLDTSYYEKALAEEEYADALKTALSAAQYGDYSYLRKLGINPSSSTGTSKSGSSSQSGSGSASASNGDETYEILQRGMKVAEKMADYGSYSLLSELTGVDESLIEKMYKTQANVTSETSGKGTNSDPLAFEVPTVKGFAEAIRLFMKGSTNDSVLKVIRQAYPTYTYDEVFTIWRKTAIDDFGFVPAKSYSGPARTFKEDGVTAADMEPHARLRALFENE